MYSLPVFTCLYSGEPKKRHGHYSSPRRRPWDFKPSPPPFQGSNAIKGLPPARGRRWGGWGYKRSNACACAGAITGGKSRKPLSERRGADSRRLLFKLRPASRSSPAVGRVPHDRQRSHFLVFTPKAALGLQHLHFSCFYSISTSCFRHEERDMTISLSRNLFQTKLKGNWFFGLSVNKLRHAKGV